MNDFKIWMLSLCGATAITSLFKILLSNSSLNKVLNIFFSVFILFYTVMPIQSVLNNNSHNNEFNSEQVDYNEIYKNGYEQIIKTSVINECEKLSVEVLTFEIFSYVNDDGHLCVEQLEIDINNNEKIAEVKAELKTWLGYEVSVK